ncbi:hypothetical protein SAMN05518854_11436 [Variovorax sp. YR266]|nr:hypothetical protein [Variovorax sp. YR266]SDZ70400.1 hypothetical protein SAMN05518854_11436 [Variovorax sp. YR266]
MIVSELPSDEMTKRREEVEPVVDKYSASVGATVEELMAEIEKTQR